LGETLSTEEAKQISGNKRRFFQKDEKKNF